MCARVLSSRMRRSVAGAILGVLVGGCGAGPQGQSAGKAPAAPQSSAACQPFAIRFAPGERLSYVQRVEIKKRWHPRDKPSYEERIAIEEEVTLQRTGR